MTLPDDTFSSDAGEPAGDDHPESTGMLKRIAIVARNAGEADALWEAIERRFRQKERIAVERAEAGAADVGVYLLSEEDFLDARTARAKAAEIEGDATARKFVVEPYTLTVKAARERLGAMLAGFTGQAGLSKLDADAATGHAKTIARVLKNDVPNEAKKDKPAPKPEKSDAEKAALKAARHREKEQAQAEKRRAKAEKSKSKAPEVDKAALRAARHREKEQAQAEKRRAKAEPKAPRTPKTPKTKEADLKAFAAKEARKLEKAKAQEEKRKPAQKKAKAKKTAPEKAPKEQKEKRKPPTPPPAAKQARKADKLAAKEAKKKPEPTAEELAAKEARKAEKHAAKEAKQKKPEPSPEELAAKEARKAEKLAAKEAKKKPEPTAEELAAKEARKAEKAAAKEAKKKPEPTAEELAAKEARKAEKAAAKEAKKKPEPTPEELAAKEARKAEKLAAKEAKKKPEPTPEELAAKEARKAEKAAAKGSAKGTKEKAEPTPEELAAKAERKEAKRKAKEGSKEERRAQAAADEDPERAAERAAARAAARAERKASKEGEGGDDDAVRPLRLVFSANEMLRPAVEDAFAASGLALDTSGSGRIDVAIYGFDGLAPDDIARRAAAIKQEKARLRIFLERLGEGDAEANRAIVRLAYACSGTVLNLGAKLRRFGLDGTMADGEPTELGRRLIAESILGVAAAKLSRSSFVPTAQLEAPDLVAARKLGAAELLAQLKYAAPAMPRTVAVHASQEDVENLADARIALGEGVPPATLPIDWSREYEDRRSIYQIKGLDFLSGALGYWYAKASGVSNDLIAAIDGALKARGMTPNVIMSRAAQIIADFVAKQSRAQARDAWEETPLTRRVRALLMYVMCCKAALKRKIKINEQACATAYGALLDAVEALRADDFYEPCSAESVQLDCLLIGIAFSLRGTPYAAGLLDACTDRLRRFQVEPGLTADGVWQGASYATHNTVLGALTQLVGDIPKDSAALAEPFAATAKRMTAFAEAMLKSNGHPPAIDGSRARSYAERLSGMRRMIARSTGRQQGAKGPLRARITDTYVFRDAQYFISHSAQSVSKDDSLAVLHAAPPAVARQDPGGVTIVFAQGESNLLVRVEPTEKIRAKHDQTPLYDPALRNSYRVDGEGNAPPSEDVDKAARFAKSWRGTGWAAAKAVEDIYANAVIGRTAIHLKQQHVLIVVDELATADGGEAEFEQYWRVAPEFAAPADLAQPLTFAAAAGEAAAEADETAQTAAAQKGAMQVAMSGEPALDIESGEAGACLRRRLRLAKGTVATIFQWTDGPAQAAVAVAREVADGWAIEASGKGFTMTASLAGPELKVEISPS